MFRVNVSLSPGEAQLLDHFHYLLNKHDVLELSKKQSEYLALQNQINPHFLYNTLEAIRADALCSGVMGVAQTSEALATFFRYTITEMGDMVTIEDELENVDNYFTIQRYRFGEKLKMRVEMDDEQLGQCKIPKLTLQPIVENAIYHGLENQTDGGWVTVSVRATEKSVLILIRDDGVGMDPASVQKINLELAKVDLGDIGGGKKRRGGIALRNVNQRVKLLFGEEYGLQLFSVSGVGTRGAHSPFQNSPAERAMPRHEERAAACRQRPRAFRQHRRAERVLPKLDGRRVAGRDVRQSAREGSLHQAPAGGSAAGPRPGVR
jgi:two-component system sensor histidine kinase YesM